ncbi:MAG TPA: MFS transporter [Geobacterales bacterium]|nr:MFS transporter [Geobacterales bacterium]
MFSGITGNVLVLGLVSFLTDVSSEMIYPLLPLFLTGLLGVTPAFLGIIEGVAESTSALLKLFSGILSDRLERRKGLILFGYSLSSIARPLVAAATVASTVLMIRFADRVGKGVRTSPRDALIADSVPPTLRGRAFGFHRAMDHAGAIVGPLVATLLLATVVKDLRSVFWLAAIPGIMAVFLLLFRLREGDRHRVSSNGNFLHAPPTPGVRRYLLIIFLFTLGNSSDAFLLLKASQAGMAPLMVTLLWSAFHGVKMLSVYGFGTLSDRLGRRQIIVSGWLVYAAAYTGFAVAGSILAIWLLFALYGLFYGLTEGVEKAFLVDLVPATERGSAFGWYNFAIGIGALPASLIFGLIWQRVSPAAAFFFGASLALLATILLLLLVRPLQELQEG